MVSDSNGGAIITWDDTRDGTNDIYAQRINATGDIQWNVNGTAVCAIGGTQASPEITDDGVGGAIITWYGNDIYASRINSTGDIMWSANGVELCNIAGSQTHPQIVGDGMGGAIVTWQDQRAGNWDIYSQKIINEIPESNNPLDILPHAVTPGGHVIASFSSCSLSVLCIATLAPVSSLI